MRSKVVHSPSIFFNDDTPYPLVVDTTHPVESVNPLNNEITRSGAEEIK